MLHKGKCALRVSNNALKFELSNPIDQLYSQTVKIIKLSSWDDWKENLSIFVIFGFQKKIKLTIVKERFYDIESD